VNYYFLWVFFSVFTYIFVIYSALPIRLHFQMIPALSLTFGSTLIWLFVKNPPWNTLETLATLTAYASVNFYGIYLSRRFNRSRRDQFVLLIKEKKSREALESKTQELKKAFKEKTMALDQNELLLREMNHRIKNNLATIQSLLNLQSFEMHDEQSRMVLKESASRVQSIKNIHQMLSESIDLKSIDVANYIKNLVKDITKSADIDSSQVDIKLRLEEIHLDLNQLIPFGLVLNELITNA